VLNLDEEMRLASILDMLKDEELGKSDYHLPIETVVWLATKLKELSDDLVTTTGVKCTGSERHWHYQLESRSYVSHEHAHSNRYLHFNNLHHHSPTEHRKA